MLLGEGEVGRRFVRTVSRIHMIWHSPSMHEGYVRIIFNIKTFFISFIQKKMEINFLYIKNMNLFYKILNAPDIDSMQC
jgi:hypothetical protein